ncbi:hypothetical protein TVAG_063020 [Trichomonas vaginalis G3]|uniref:Uncharacterized protein n=1 Tax=Trichomonas vaginalis (strain ATCC PRA-98 / G3) TaxID=412133 RepID=A2DLR4_TRIV3|nr:hypothetical protein TVAGG3_0581170 [Trichomonas vaginalis G3]EAY18697.1 hypothetical protein TVAG_063020 [Trichomonas vaginalis G3]KAI5522596.1 hypothetical protein TVAGG3_0581170 [Trichomonas vaginalis G3]|eukprot:XP_001579683.1 hypothetical protein [Trichomonas vaginalis G3]
MFLSLICGNLPTYKYFVIKDGYEEIDIHEPGVQSSYEYLCGVVPKFLPDFTTYHAITLIHCWHKKEGNYYAVEVMTQRIRYLVTVQDIEGTHYLYSVRILNCDGPGGAKWSQPEQDIIDLVMEEAKEKFGQDLKLRNVAAFTTRLQGTKYAHFVADVETDSERFLINVHLEKPFGGQQYSIKDIVRVE